MKSFQLYDHRVENIHLYGLNEVNIHFDRPIQQSISIGNGQNNMNKQSNPDEGGRKKVPVYYS